jgi:hypothetical protein
MLCIHVLILYPHVTFHVVVIPLFYIAQLLNNKGYVMIITFNQHFFI